ncbi:AAA family ATPase [Methanosarcinales archaeon]|nr:MAG: AAA family ATPase [Methanosarcinales archaeon]
MNLEEVYERSGKIFRNLFEEIEKVVVGQRDALEQIIIAILCEGHVLIEGNPGLGKTLTISTLSKVLDLKFSRIQCTPDLMPSDITGTYVIEEVDGRKEFRFEEGPIFANIVLADEINRASPKTQSALLEAMQERQVSIGKQTFKLDRPFFVLATQNPIEMEGTFPLPEAQLDRFLLKVLMDYPTPEEEMRIIGKYAMGKPPSVNKVVSKEELLALQQLVREVPISDELKDKVIKLVISTRKGVPEIAYGASPRASIGMILTAKARALLHGRTYVSLEDIEKMAYPILRHRIILSFEAERKGIVQDEIIGRILSSVLS